MAVGVCALLLGDLASQNIDLTTVAGLPAALRAALTSSTVPAPGVGDQGKVPGGYLSAPGALTAFRSQSFYPANAKQSGVALSTALLFVGIIIGVVLTAGTTFALYVIRSRVQRARGVLRPGTAESSSNDPPVEPRPDATETMT